jgi:hypothetical protein
LLSQADFVHIPYTSDLTLAGNLYACRSLALGRVRASNLHLNPLRNLSDEIAAELSLRRYLAGEHISFKALEGGPFTHPERREIMLGGRPCHVINTAIAHKQRLRRIQARPSALLHIFACVPEAALNSEKWGYQDLLIFTFTLGEPKPAIPVPGKAQAGRKLDYLIYIFPEAWRNARLGGPTPGITLQNAGDKEITVEVCGLDSNRDHVNRAIRLPPHQPVVAEGFTNLAYLSTQRVLLATISVHLPTLNRTLRISPDLWGNLGLDGTEIVLAGYIEAGEFRRHARRLHAPDRPRESEHPLSQNLSLPVQDLLPLPQLITWLRAVQKTR